MTTAPVDVEDAALRHAAIACVLIVAMGVGILIGAPQIIRSSAVVLLMIPAAFAWSAVLLTVAWRSRGRRAHVTWLALGAPMSYSRLCQTS